ncbi:hypothetical protein Pmani_017687 [Petrolisthes manimaculis]|uniref:Afadin-and alpha-actinin-binding protein n=1 Tax=Petrolisthes manimaculis TaxID=1843537 RepID=A0AAE1U5K1_9EUCA|nr:hypothetical protein Pmani_017687 [Petrolisthes manimaculis]
MRRGELSYWVSLSHVPEQTDPRVQRNSSALESLPYFCTTANIKSAILYLSQELQGMGLSCPLIESGSERVNLVALVNTCWEITQLYRSSIRDNNTLYDQRRRDVADINHLQSNVRDVKVSVDEKERLVCEAQEKERQAITFTKTLAAKLRAEKEDVRKLNSVLQQREAQHQHELRKKEVEHNRLVDRLHRLVSGDKFTDTRTPGMSLSSRLTRHNSTRAKWKTDSSTARHEEDLQRRILGQYESWVGQLNDENEQLKSFLSATSTQIAKLVTKFTKSEGQTMLEGDLNTSLNSSTYSSDSLENVVVSLEFPAFREQMQRSFDHNINLLTNLLKQNSSDRSLGEVIDETQLKKDILDSTVKGQQSLCSTLKKKEDQQQQQQQQKTDDDDEDDGVEEEESDLSFVVEGRDIEERLSLDKTREEVCLEKRLLHEEKERFTEATIRLNRERASFEAEKVELLRRQFLQDLPSTLSDSGRDLAINTHETSECVVNIDGLAEGYDSPHQRLLSAVPNLTSPQGNITYLQGGYPLPVLGPTKLPSQQQQHFSDTKKGWRSSRRL